MELSFTSLAFRDIIQLVIIFLCDFRFDLHKMKKGLYLLLWEQSSNFFLIEPVFITFECCLCLHSLYLPHNKHKYQKIKLQYFFEQINFLEVLIFPSLSLNERKNSFLLRVEILKGLFIFNKIWFCLPLGGQSPWLKTTKIAIASNFIT